MSSELYDVLPLPVTLGNIIDKNNNRLKPFVGIYFPVELLDKMKWSKDTRLILTIEKGYLKIVEREGAAEADLLFDLNELRYVPLEEDEF